MIGGRLGDIFEHQFVLTIGMSIFNVATIVCAVVLDKIGLVVGRAFQGETMPDYSFPHTLTCRTKVSLQH